MIYDSSWQPDQISCWKIKSPTTKSKKNRSVEKKKSQESQFESKVCGCCHVGPDQKRRRAGEQEQWSVIKEKKMSPCFCWRNLEIRRRTRIDPKFLRPFSCLKKRALVVTYCLFSCWPVSLIPGFTITSVECPPSSLSSPDMAQPRVSHQVPTPEKRTSDAGRWYFLIKLK